MPDETTRDYEKLWRQVSADATRMQNMLNELGICDDCGKPWGNGMHDDPVALGVCTQCRKPIGCMSSCCWTGPDSIWLHADPPAKDHEATPRKMDEHRAYETARRDDGDHADPLSALRRVLQIHTLPWRDHA